MKATARRSHLSPFASSVDLEGRRVAQDSEQAYTVHSLLHSSHGLQRQAIPAPVTFAWWRALFVRGSSDVSSIPLLLIFLPRAFTHLNRRGDPFIGFHD